MRMRKRKSAVLVVAGVALFGGNVPSASAAAWTVQDPAAVRTASEELEFNDVSCPKMTSCVAVGEADVESGPDDLVVHHWDGATWYNKSVPLPGTASSFELAAVDCVTPTSCWTVGTGLLDGRTTPMASRFEGGTWKSRTLPMLRNMFAAIVEDVDCVPGASLTMCMAVGFSVRNPDSPTADPYAALWTQANGWSLVKVPEPLFADVPVLAGVSCPARDLCIATGAIFPEGQKPQPWSVQWDGAVWSLLDTPLVPSTTGGALADIDCPSTRYCVAVGSSDLPDPAGSEPVAYHWNGAKWSIKRTPDGEYTLAGVSCASKSVCVAVGRNVVDGPIVETHAAIRWSDQAWTTESLPPTPAGPESDLNAVSCPSSTRCTAVGSAGPDEVHRSLLVERYA